MRKMSVLLGLSGVVLGCVACDGGSEMVADASTEGGIASEASQASQANGTAGAGAAQATSGTADPAGAALAVDAPLPTTGAGTAAPGPAPSTATPGDSNTTGDAMPVASVPGPEGEQPAAPTSMDDDPTEPVEPVPSLWVPDPSWNCGLPDGIPPPSEGEPAFSVTMQVEALDVGQTQYGHRVVFNTDDGEISGMRLSGTVAAGAYDYQLQLANGVMEIEQIGVLRATDGANIYFRHCGLAPTADAPARVVADFEAPNSGAHAWLNQGKLLGERVVDEAKGTVTVHFYEFEGNFGAATELPRSQVMEPAGDVDQPWECPPYTGRPGEVVYRESVGIGGSLAVGESKNGRRNIIPITGGTTLDRLPGAVIPGGADYQLSADEFMLDARYVIRSEDGELVTVRNCGAASALVPIFEARVDGPYAFFNENRWLSSSPQIAIGAVNLTIYERVD